MTEKHIYLTNKKQFTFLELLVVIGIISILLSLLIPSLKSARDTSISAVCKSNLKQIMIAEYNYAKDNNNWVFHRGRYFRWGGWSQTVLDGHYMPEESPVARCPAEAPYYYENGGGYGRSSVVNYWKNGVQYEFVKLAKYDNPARDDWIGYFMKLDTATEPSETSFVLDSWDNVTEMQRNWMHNPNRHGPAVRHLGKANINTLDGHARGRSLNSLREKNWTRAFVGERGNYELVSW